MAPRPERRRVRRVLASLNARLVAEDGTVLGVRVENLSAVGLLAAGVSALPVETRCRIELAPDAPGGAIVAHGTVVRSAEGRMGVRFDDLPWESFERLRAVLLAHTDDPAALDAELEERLGFLGGDAA